MLWTYVQYQPLLRSLPVLVPLIHTSLTASVYTTLAVAVERAATFAPKIAMESSESIMRDVLTFYLLRLSKCVREDFC